MAKGQKIHSVDTQVVVENNRAIIKTGQIKVDARKSGTHLRRQRGPRRETLPNFKGDLDVNLPDLGSFAPGCCKRPGRHGQSRRQTIQGLTR